MNFDDPNIDSRELPEQQALRPPVGEEAGVRVIGLDPLIPDAAFDIVSGESLRKFTKLSLHPIARLALDLFVDGTFAATHEIEPNQNNDYDRNPEFRALDDLILASIDRQRNGLEDATWKEVLRSLLQNARTYGVALGELVYDVVPTDGEWTLSRIKTIYPYLFSYDVDGFGNLKTVTFDPSTLDPDFVGQRAIQEKLVIAPWPQLENGNWYGRSELMPVVSDIARLEATEIALAEGTQRLAVRPILHRYDKQRDHIKTKQLQSGLAGLNSGDLISWAGFSSGVVSGGEPIEYDQIEVMADRASPEGLAQGQQLAIMLRERISRTLRIPDDLGFTTTSTGSLAKAGVELDVFTAGLIAAQRWVKSMVDRQLIPAMTRFNWRPDRLPKGYLLPEMRWQALKEDDFESKVQSVIAGVQAGLFSVNEGREMIELPPVESITPDEQPEEVEEESETAVKPVQLTMF